MSAPATPSTAANITTAFTILTPPHIKTLLSSPSQPFETLRWKQYQHQLMGHSKRFTSGRYGTFKVMLLNHDLLRTKNLA